MAGIRARVPARSLGEHVPLGRTEMANEITQCERAFAVRPFDAITRDALGETPCTPADALDVRHEAVNGRDYHATMDQSEIGRIEVIVRPVYSCRRASVRQ